VGPLNCPAEIVFDGLSGVAKRDIPAWGGRG